MSVRRRHPRAPSYAVDASPARPPPSTRRGRVFQRLIPTQEQPFEDTGALNFWTPPRETEDPRLQLFLLWDGLERELVNLFGNRAGFMHERMATGEVEQDARAGIGTVDARQAWGALIAHATKWKEWSDGSDERYEEGLVAVYLTAGRGLIPRRGDWLPGTPWDMSDLAPLSPSVAERCEPAPEDATFTHVCG